MVLWLWWLLFLLLLLLGRLNVDGDEEENVAVMMDGWGEEERR